MVFNRSSLKKPDISNLKRPNYTDPSHPLGTVLRSGLSKRFVDMNDVEDLGSLDDDNFYVKNDNEKDWD